MRPSTHPPVQQTGKAMEMHVRTDMEGAIHLGQGFGQFQGIGFTEIKWWREILPGNPDRLLVEVDDYGASVFALLGMMHQADHDFENKKTVGTFQIGFKQQLLQLHQLGLIGGRTESSIGEAAHLTAIHLVRSAVTLLRRARK